MTNLVLALLVFVTVWTAVYLVFVLIRDVREDRKWWSEHE
jgi:hypothetical protein